MARIASVKFYNFTVLSAGKHIALFVKFYDADGKLVVLDFSNPISHKVGTSCEIKECIVTSNYYFSQTVHDAYCSFHTGNYNKEVGLGKIGYCWLLDYSAVSPTIFLKIEFKIPQYFSDIQIIHSPFNTDYTCGFNECDYDIEYENGTIKKYHYISNGSICQYNVEQILNNQFDQRTYDSLFDSIDFDKKFLIYDTKIGYAETLETNNFRNMSKDLVGKLKVLYIKPVNTLISCLVSFNQKQTWKTFNGNNWIEISDTSASNMILNCMDIEVLNSLDKNKLISGGFTGDLDFKIAMKTNDENKTPSVTKIYIEYK